MPAEDASFMSSFVDDHPRCSVTGAGGAVLTCMHTVRDRNKPAMLIALPFGVPASVAQAAFEAFGSDFNVVTWESRYILDPTQEFTGAERLAPRDHVEDMVRILGALGIATCDLVGYCSGAGISLLAARRHPDVFTRLILVNGEYQLFRKGHTATDYQRSIDTFLPVVATSRERAGFIFSKMADISKASGGDTRTELDRQINLPFSREESLYRYAKNYMAYRDFDALDVAAGVDQVALVLTGRRDEHSDSENSQAVHARLLRSSQFVDDQGDHYEFCRSGSATLGEIGAFLGRPPRSRFRGDTGVIQR